MLPGQFEAARAIANARLSQYVKYQSGSVLESVITGVWPAFGAWDIDSSI